MDMTITMTITTMMNLKMIKFKKESLFKMKRGVMLWMGLSIRIRGIIIWSRISSVIIDKI